MGLAVEAAWCAQDQEYFFDYQHALFENQGAISINQSTLTGLAAEIGLDSNTFSECLSSRTHRADVERARRAAMNKRVNSTPTFFINNQRIENNLPYQDFQAILDRELAAVQ